MLPVLVLRDLRHLHPDPGSLGVVQGVAQVFPMYWVGLGMRSAFLPDAAAALEVGGSWRTLETVLVPGARAMTGLLVTPSLLRRMAGRQSGFAGRGRDARGDAVGQVSRW
jgi:ABC-2 type transport system permease protein